MKTGATLLIMLALTGCERGRPWDFERMRHQARADPWDSNPALPGGMVMQPPPPGTVPFPPLQTAQPIRPADQSYRIYCQLCHGAAGFGGTVLASNLLPSARFSLRRPWSGPATAGYVDSVIRSGIGLMPSLAWQLSAPDREAVAVYLLALLRRPPRDSAGILDSLNALANRAIDSSWRSRRIAP